MTISQLDTLHRLSVKHLSSHIHRPLIDINNAFPVSPDEASVFDPIPVYHIYTTSDNDLAFVPLRAALADSRRLGPLALHAHSLINTPHFKVVLCYTYTLSVTCLQDNHIALSTITVTCTYPLPRDDTSKAGYP